MSRAVIIIGIVLAAWMVGGRWLFGVGGQLTWWYLPIGVAYVALSLWLGSRITRTRAKGRHTGRATIVSAVLSWVCAVAFGLTVPDRVGGALESIVSHGGSDTTREMSIALCNPFVILACAILIASITFAFADARDPRPEEDEWEPAPHPFRGA